MEKISQFKDISSKVGGENEDIYFKSRPLKT